MIRFLKSIRVFYNRIFLHIDASDQTSSNNFLFYNWILLAFRVFLYNSLRYEEHNELVKKTIPKENLLVWNLKDGWEPLCTFLKVPIPDVPIPRENTTGDFKWAEDYFYQDKVTRNGIKYFVCYCILIIIVLFCIIYFPIKYAWKQLYQSRLRMLVTKSVGDKLNIWKMF